ncbi:hypothetical protein LCGC14_1642340 [marine sediment metagenome]|uniref:Uncharacterized protein n=1 Tax=marine sediment metagenome TaxID=412755 RepID=A0A0F9HZ76_9ZZZZ
MYEIKTAENKYCILGFDKSDITKDGIAIILLKNGIKKVQVPVGLVLSIGLYLFPDNPVYYDKIKDKIEVIIE